MLDQWVKNKKT